MYRIIGERGTGRTTKLMELARNTGAIFVGSKWAVDLAPLRGFDDIKAMTFEELAEHRFDDPSQKFVIDNMEHFIENFVGGNLIGYCFREEGTNLYASKDIDADVCNS